MACILIIDDQPENLEIVKHTLRSYLGDCEVLQAHSGEEGLRMAFENHDRMDLIITDVKMPEKDGFELCREYKDQVEGYPVPVLMLSGIFVEGQDRARGFESGADGYLCKPYRLDELIAQVQVLLRIKKTEDTLRRHEADLEAELERRTGDLVASRRRFQTLFEASPDAIWVITQQGRLIDANPAGCRLAGKEATHLRGTDMTLQFNEQEATSMREQFAIWAVGETDILELELEHGLLGTIYLEVSGQAFESEGEEALILHLRDVSKRKHIERQLQSAHTLEAIGRLSGGVAHDFNNLLTSILGFSNLVKDNLPDDTDTREDMDKIIESAELAVVLTRRLMLFGQKQVVPLHPVSLNHITRDADELLRRAIGTHIELVTLLGDEIGDVTSDEMLVHQLLIDLVTNARDAMPGGGKVVIKTSTETIAEGDSDQHPDAQPGTYSVLRVSDKGRGIPDSIREDIFEPFFTTKESDTRTSGLGLSSVYGIVKRAGGFVLVKENEGGGTRIEAWFPALEQQSTPRPLRDISERAPGGTETILVVEDEKHVLRLCIKLLDRIGYTVLHASNGSEALRVADQYMGRIDLVLTDVVMPQLSGPEMARELQHTRPESKILFTSGYTATPLPAGSDDKKPPPFIMKPYTRETLARKVREVLDAPDEN